MTWNRKMAQRRKRSVDPDAPADPAVFLEGGTPGKYRCVSMLQEQHGGHLYCVSVCALRADDAGLFATVGANRASVYRLEDDGGVTLLRAFKDDNEHEQYFACAWCEASTGELLLALAGHTGVVRVLDVSAEVNDAQKHAQKKTPSLFRDLRGHGGSVNDVRAHPCAPHLLLSASKDESCRLWNVDNGVCVFIFSGALGHRNEVLSVDVKPTPLFSDADDDEARDARDFVFVSGAMDNMVKVWSTRGYSHLLELSERWPEQQKKGTAAARVGAAMMINDDRFLKKNHRRDFEISATAVKTRRAFGGAAEAEALAAALDDGTLDPFVTPFPTKHVQTPVFSSFKVHGNYVDCVRWFGDLILSKSVEQKTRLWAFDRRKNERGEVGSAFRVVREFAAKHADIWFLRFAVDVGAGCVACGNRVGDVFVWNANAAAGFVRGGGRAGAPRPPALVATLSDRRCAKAVRQTAIARGGRTVLAACDGGTVWRWDYERQTVTSHDAEKTTRDDERADERRAGGNAKADGGDGGDGATRLRRDSDATPETRTKHENQIEIAVSDSENPSVVDLLSSDDDDDDDDALGVSRDAGGASSPPAPNSRARTESFESDDAICIE